MVKIKLIDKEMQKLAKNVVFSIERDKKRPRETIEQWAERMSKILCQYND